MLEPKGGHLPCCMQMFWRQGSPVDSRVPNRDTPSKRFTLWREQNTDNAAFCSLYWPRAVLRVRSGFRAIINCTRRLTGLIHPPETYYTERGEHEQTCSSSRVDAGLGREVSSSAEGAAPARANCFIC